MSGQNIAMIMNPDDYPSVEDLIDVAADSWFNEHQLASMEFIDSFHDPEEDGIVIGHFTQMVQDKTKVMGCAVAREYFANLKGGPYAIFIVCNYGFNNISDEKVYEATDGEAGSGCDGHLKDKDYQHLCAFSHFVDQKRPVKVIDLSQHPEQLAEMERTHKKITKTTVQWKDPATNMVYATKEEALKHTNHLIKLTTTQTSYVQRK